MLAVKVCTLGWDGGPEPGVPTEGTLGTPVPKLGAEGAEQADAARSSTSLRDARRGESRTLPAL